MVQPVTLQPAGDRWRGAVARGACRWVTEAREAHDGGGSRSEASAEKMLYAYCALLDESVLNRASQDDGYRRWRKDPLQARFFSTLNAGEELWERIRQLLREYTADAAVLTYFFRTLELGFVGQYRAEDDERREDVAQALGARVPPFSLTPGEAPGGGSVPSQLRSGRRMYWCGWAAGIVALAALWLTFTPPCCHRWWRR
ncbi:type VI secretion system protein TssL, short form [Klebsiella pneumoniae]|nr:type VI secretion system protein TssL, short form [Klebsiella pneumoniae]